MLTLLMASKTKFSLVWPRVADLKVISRTSVMQYKTGVNRNLREIARRSALPICWKEQSSVPVIASVSMPS